MQASETDTPQLSIVVPTLNEAGNIDNLLKAVFQTTQGTLNIEVIVVDDGSTDGTREKVTHWSESHPVRLLARDDKCDLATAVTDGAKLSASDVVLVMDADLSHPPARIVALAQPIIDDTHDIAIGSRYIRGGHTTGWPWYRQVLSRGATLLAWPFADARDPMSGFFCVRKERLCQIDANACGYKIGLEVLAGNHTDLRVTEIPITFAQRVEGQSKLKASTIFQYLERLMVLSGGSVGIQVLQRFAGITILCMLLDMLLFLYLRHVGQALNPSQIISFFVSTIVAYILHTRWTLPAQTSPTKQGHTAQFVSFTILSLLALFLRGGLLGNLIEHGHWTESMAIIPAMLVTNMVQLGVICYLIFPQATLEQNPWLRWRVAVIGSVIYVLLLKLVYMGVIDLIPEEAYYWNYSKHLSLSYLDHPPMVAWLIALGTSVFDDTEFGVRIGSMACWLVTLWFVYRMATDLYDKSTAMRSVLLVSVLPFFFMTGFLMTPDAPLTACWAGTLFFLQRALISEHYKSWYGAGIFLGLGLLSKYTIGLIVPTAFVMMMLNQSMRRQLLRPEPYLAALIALVIFTPVLLWNAQHQWASFVFQGPRRMASQTVFSEHILLGSVALLLTPIGLLAVIGAWLSNHQNERTQKIDAKRRLARIFAAVFTLIPLAVFVYFSLKHEPKLNWTGPLWLAIIPLIAFAMRGDRHIASRHEYLMRYVHQLWQPTILITLLIMGGLMHYLVLGIPGIGYSAKMKLPIAWEEMGSMVEEVEESIEAQTHQEPLVVGLDKYFTASQIAFYRNKLSEHETNEERNEGFENTTADHLFDGTGLMYRYWFTPQDQAGRVILLVSRSEDKLHDQRLDTYFDTISPIAEARLVKNDQPVGCFYYRVGYRYHVPSVVLTE